MLRAGDELGAQIEQNQVSLGYARGHGGEVETHNGHNDEARKRIEINRLLGERLGAIGLSVPGMPRGSPSMDGHLYHNVKDPYDVLLVRRNGSAIVYQSYR